MLPKRRPDTKNKGSSPLDEKARALAEQEVKLRAEMEKHQRLIEKAPEIARERQKRQRDEFVNRASRNEGRTASRATLKDPRYELNNTIPARQRSLRSERQRGRLLFFVLLMLFAAVAYWGYFTFTQQ